MCDREDAFVARLEERLAAKLKETQDAIAEDIFTHGNVVLSENSLAQFVERLHSDHPPYILHPTDMVLRSDLTDKQVALAHAAADHFAKGETDV